MIKRRPVGYKSLKEIVHDYLVESVRSGRLQPSQRINEREICEHLGVSRTPVREALLQLEPVGLVSFLPRKGIVINALTERDVEELFATIGILEVAAARLAVPLLTEADLVKLENYLATMEALIGRRDLQSLNRAMEDFHDVHLSRCPNGLLVQTIRQLKRRFYDSPHRIAFVTEWETQLLTEHKRLVNLFQQRDVDGVVAFMQLHWSWEHNKAYALRSYFPMNRKNQDKDQNPGATTGGASGEPQRVG